MSVNPQPGDRAPAVIGPYRIVRELGRGGMGVVYEALHETLGKRVAIKEIHPQLRSEAQFERFVREGRAACQVRHPNVVEVFELGMHAGAPYLVMALLDGISLDELLRASKQLRLPAVLELMLPILSAVSAAHAAGVVHRDLKPSNIMLARSERQKLQPTLLDFGASKLEETSTAPLTHSGTMLGTLPYMAAEQVYASRNADALSDQYSLAVILYECATGRRPFAAESGYQLMQAIMTEPVSPPSALEPSLPSELDAVLLRALRREPSERYPSVNAFARALLPFASDEARAEWSAELEASARDSSDLHESRLARGATLPDSARPALVARPPENTRVGSGSGVVLEGDVRNQPRPAQPRWRVPARAWIALAVTLTPTHLPPAGNDAPAKAAHTRKMDPRSRADLEATSSGARLAPPTRASQAHTSSALAESRPPALVDADTPPPKAHPSAADAPERERRAHRPRAKTGPSASKRTSPSQPSTAERTGADRERAAVQLGTNGAPILE